MREKCYNYTSSNRINSRGATANRPRPDTRKVLLMNPHITTPIEFIPISSRTKDKTGHRIGRLVVLGPIGRRTRGRIMWLCLCDCGNTSVLETGSITKGKIKSCGCLMRELAVKRNTKHGLRNTKIYRVWRGIKDRCLNSDNSTYQKYYGVRGISICDEWRDSFECFRDHVMELSHYGEDGYSIDRIDNDGDYEPGNVQWATRVEQGRNRRSNRLLTFDGRTQCVAEWAEELGISRYTIYGRLKSGWTVERALREPVVCGGTCGVRP